MIYVIHLIPEPSDVQWYIFPCVGIADAFPIISTDCDEIILYIPSGTTELQKMQCIKQKN